jgi:hypothetical protein
MNIPGAYLCSAASFDRMSTGCWITVNGNKGSPVVSTDEVSGELIAVQSDTFYILTKTYPVALPKARIRNASLLLTKNQSGNYFLATGLGVIPNIAGAISTEYPGEFLMMAIPYFVIGSALGVSEVINNELRYPEANKLSEFVKFSRFPQGIPPGVKMRDLSLDARY